jgi:hypothetical protein
VTHREVRSLGTRVLDTGHGPGSGFGFGVVCPVRNVESLCRVWDQVARAQRNWKVRGESRCVRGCNAHARAAAIFNVVRHLPSALQEFAVSHSNALHWPIPGRHLPCL